MSPTDPAYRQSMKSSGGPERPSRRFRPGGPGAGGLTPQGMAGLAPWLALVVLCLSLYLPGLSSLPPFDRDEGRFVQATRQMLETGDYVRIRYLDEARNKKPVGIHWAQAAAALPFGGAQAPLWAFRLPSVLGAMIGVLLIFAIGGRIFDPQTGFVAAALMASAIVMIGEAHLGKTDAALFATAVAAQGCLALVYLRARAGMVPGWPVVLGFWVATGLAGLLKGPVIPVISLLTILSLGIADRSWRWLLALKPWFGLPLAITIVAPWLILIQQATGGQFLAQAAGDDLLPKLLGGKIFHSSPPGYYLLLVWVIFFPASMLLVPGLTRAWQLRLLPSERFCLAWAIPAWIMFELTPNKLPHYILPVLPALALLGGRWLVAISESDDGTARRWGVRLGVAVAALVAVTLGAAGLAAPYLLDGRIDPAGIITAIIGLGTGFLILRSFFGHDAPLVGVLSAVVGTGLIAATLLGSIGPRLEALWVSRSAAELVILAAGGQKPAEPVAVGGYAEPSLVVLLGTPTKLTGGGGAAEALLKGTSRFVLVESREEASFQAGLAGSGRAVQSYGEVAGLNYSRGQKVSLRLYALKAAG